MLNRSTRLHGTPLYAALVLYDDSLAVQLIQAGARLSPEESRDPAGEQGLKDFFENHRDSWTVYYR